MQIMLISSLISHSCAAVIGLPLNGPRPYNFVTVVVIFYFLWSIADEDCIGHVQLIPNLFPSTLLIVILA